MVLGQEVARLNKVVQQVHKGNQAADFDTFGKTAWTFELRVNAVAALEAALLDLLGKALNVPVCELLGPGKQRETITVLGYLFYLVIGPKPIFLIWKIHRATSVLVSVAPSESDEQRSRCASGGSLTGSLWL
ncbi:hypothetical protein ACLB1T_04910 [Escherichia coli]